MTRAKRMPRTSDSKFGTLLPETTIFLKFESLRILLAANLFTLRSWQFRTAGPLVDPERRTDDPINSELTLGRADRKGCGNPAGRLRGLTVWQHVRLHRVAHACRIADPLRNVQRDPARSCRD